MCVRQARRRQKGTKIETSKLLYVYICYVIQVDGKLLCWLCTLSFKRALAKTKQTEADRKAHMKMTQIRASKHKEQK